jgi:hypothetical protein
VTGGAGGRGSGAADSGAAGSGGAGGRGGRTGTEGGEGGEAEGGTGATDGGSAGAPVAGSAGSGGGLAYECSTAYAGPMGGPREDGPPLITMGCSAIPDETVLERYPQLGTQGFSGQMPTSLYWEDSDQIVRLGETCSTSLETTLDNGLAEGLGESTGQYETDWFYEVVFCNDSLRTLYRELRCDYFDGTELANATTDELAFLGSLLYWHDNYNFTGSTLLGYSSYFGGAGDFVQMCSIRVAYGDFGLCDQVELLVTTHLLGAGSEVSLGQPSVVRTLEGQCH